MNTLILFVGLTFTSTKNKSGSTAIRRFTISSTSAANCSISMPFLTPPSEGIKEEGNGFVRFVSCISVAKVTAYLISRKKRVRGRLRGQKRKGGRRRGTVLEQSEYFLF